MKVVSFNILSHYYIDDTSYNNEYKGINPKLIDRENRRKRSFKFIKTSNADIILLQEVDKDIRTALVASFPNYKVMPIVAYHPKDNVKVGQVTMITKKYKGAKQIKLEFKKTKVGYAMLECKTPDPLIIFNIHLDSDVSNVKRTAEAKELLRYVKSNVVADARVIIGGDFNTNNTTMHKLFTDAGFISTIEKPDASGTYLCKNPMIDYIYIRNLDIVHSSVSKITKPTSRCPTTVFKEFGSDHVPVVAKLL